MKAIILGVALTLVLGLAMAGCGEKDTSNLAPATGDDEPLVFGDQYGPGVTYQAFEFSKTDAVQLDNSQAAQGTASLRVSVPEVVGGALPWFAGGAFTNQWARDLSGYNALTFWAKADQSVTLDIVGIGNDNTGTSRFEASVSGLPLTTTWQKFIVPLPLPSKLAVEAGLFWFAENENDMGYQFWMDEIRFENANGISNPRPSMVTSTSTTFTGARVSVEGTKVVFDVNGTDVTVDVMPAYFNFESSNELVVRMNNGVPWVVGAGDATVTAMMGDIPVDGAIVVTAIASPSTAAPTPTMSADSVISIYSDAYNDWAVDRFETDWDEAMVTDLLVAGNEVKAYTETATAGAEFFAGIEFANPTIDASDMNYIHLDIWVPDATYIKIKLVDFGPDGVYGGAPDSEEELFFHAGTTPPFYPDMWASLDIPMVDFMTNLPALASTEHLAQMIISTDGDVAFVDNIYLHK